MKKNKGTLCWQCKRAKANGCPWFTDFTPVEGWVAKKTKIKKRDGEYADSYMVKNCPLFIKDDN